ncbi:MAG: hypothetical protein AAFY17_14165 [Cyanobacteria bacterium J06642_11]
MDLFESAVGMGCSALSPPSVAAIAEPMGCCPHPLSGPSQCGFAPKAHLSPAAISAIVRSLAKDLSELLENLNRSCVLKNTFP